MRSLVVYLVLLLLFAVSIGIGVVASDWPGWCRWLNWCSANWPPAH
jgi:hypothetical protein